MIHKSFDAKYLAYLARFIRKRDKEAFVELYNYTHKKIDSIRTTVFERSSSGTGCSAGDLYSHLQEYRFSERRFTLFVMDEPDHLPCLLRFSPQGTQPVI